MRSQPMGLRRKQKTWLHLILAVGMFVYLYSPLLDHWAGHETYARPHTHIHVENIFAQYPVVETNVHVSEHGEHEEGVLCLLDINALFSVIFYFNAGESICTIQNSQLVFDLLPPYQQVSAIYLSSLDPPPRI